MQGAQIYVDDKRRRINVTVSVGVTLVPAGHAARPETVIGSADDALYDAKQEGRNCVRVSDPPGVAAPVPWAAA